MKAQRFTKKIFENLANGKYLIFRNGKLVDTLTITQFHSDGSRSSYPIKATFNGIEIKDFKQFHVLGDCYFIGASEIGIEFDEPEYYRISIGYQGATDSCLCINDKEYCVESRAWNLISIIQNSEVDIDDDAQQNLLRFIYHNFEEDRRNYAQ